VSHRPRSGFVRAFFLMALGIGLLADVPALAPQVVQSLEALVAQRRRELARARLEYEAAVAAFNVVDGQWQAALDEVSRARRSGDESALERAWASAQERAGPFSAQEQRVQTARDSLTAIRSALMEAIEARLQQLLDQMDASPSSAQRLTLNALFNDLRNELQALDEESQAGLRLQPVVLPEITFDPRDGPEERRTKAQLLERQADFVQTLIDEADDRIRALNNRLRIRRQSVDLLASVDRFDDTRVPVVTGGPPRGGVAPDSTLAGGRPLTLEEQIEQLGAYREQLQDRRQSLLLRAEIFRGAARSITW
jgi:Mg2+ and Co2+ transporter CorA